MGHNGHENCIKELNCYLFNNDHDQYLNNQID